MLERGPDVHAVSLKQAGVRSLAFVTADYETLISFRGPMIEALLADGVTLSYVGPRVDAPTRTWLDARGIGIREIPISRNIISPLSDCRTLFALWRAMRELAPDAVLTTRVKSSVYGQLVARWRGVKVRFGYVTGLGYVFTERRGDWRWRLTNMVARTLYSRALRGATAVAFQNSDDERELRAAGVVQDNVPTAVVPGSGVDTDFYRSAPLPEHNNCLFVGRLLTDKGLGELIAAARIVKARRPEIRFTVAGPEETNPAAFPTEAIRAAVKEGLIDYAGPVDDVRPCLSACRIFVFPSYREGTPRAVLEAMAMGRPVVTTDVPGCRETVQAGRNGLLVPARDAAALAEAVLQLAENPARASQMGAEGRRIAEEKYEVRNVTSGLLAFFARAALIHAADTQDSAREEKIGGANGAPIDWTDRVLLAVLCAFPIVASVRAWTSADDTIMILYGFTLLGGLVRGRPLEEFRQWLGIFATPLGYLSILFFLYAAASFSWSVMTDYSHVHLLKWTSIVVMATAIAMRLRQIPSIAFQQYFAAATVLALIVFLVDYLLGHSLVRFVYGWLHDRHVNPNAMALSLFLWPALATIVAAGHRAAAIILWLLAGIAFLSSSSQASLIGFVAGSIALAVVSLLPTIGAWLIVAGATIAMALAALWGWLATFLTSWSPQWFLSESYANVRIEIWRKHADLIAADPFFGQGALGIGKVHPHSFPIQIWVEFGAIGAILATAMLLVAGVQLCRIDDRYRPFAFAAAVAIYVNFSVSYGLWEIQFLSMLLLVSLVLLHGVATTASVTKRP